MKVITVNDLIQIIEEFEKRRSNNYSLYNAYDYYYGDGSGVSFIEKLKSIRDQALEESKGKHAAFISDQLFVKYQQVILDKKLDPESLAYKVIYNSYLGVANVNRFMRDLTKRYAGRGHEKPYFLNIVNAAAKTRQGDLVWEALRRLERADITLTHDEMAMVLENRESAMGLMMAFAEFSKTPHRNQLVNIFANVYCAEDHPLSAHLVDSEEYNHKHFDLHPLPVTERALGMIGAIKVMSRANKEFEIADLNAMLINMHAAVEYAQAVRLLFSDEHAFDEASRKEMLPKLRKNPERAYHMMAVTIHVRKLQEQDSAEKTCLTSQQLETLHAEDLSVFSALLRHLPHDLNTALNIDVLYRNIHCGAVILPMLECLRVRGIKDIQVTFNLIVNNAQYIASGSMMLLPNLAEHQMFDGNMLDKILLTPDYAEPLIKGLLVWCKAMQDTAHKRRGSLVSYRGSLQDSSRQLNKLMFDAKDLMFLHPDKAAKIAQAAVVHPNISTPYKSLEDLGKVLGLNKESSYSPMMFREQVAERVAESGPLEEMRDSQRFN